MEPCRVLPPNSPESVDVDDAPSHRHPSSLLARRTGVARAGRISGAERCVFLRCRKLGSCEQDAAYRLSTTASTEAKVTKSDRERLHIFVSIRHRGIARHCRLDGVALPPRYPAGVRDRKSVV